MDRNGRAHVMAGAFTTELICPSRVAKTSGRQPQSASSGIFICVLPCPVYRSTISVHDDVQGATQIRARLRKK